MIFTTEEPPWPGPTRPFRNTAVALYTSGNNALPPAVILGKRYQLRGQRLAAPSVSLDPSVTACSAENRYHSSNQPACCLQSNSPARTDPDGRPVEAPATSDLDSSRLAGTQLGSRRMIHDPSVKVGALGRPGNYLHRSRIRPRSVPSAARGDLGRRRRAGPGIQRRRTRC